MLRSRRYSRYGNELPATLRRSCQEAQDTFTTARANAVQVHGEGDQADRAAFTALKEKFEKRGDHWIAKREPGDDKDRPAGRPGRKPARFSPEADIDGGTAGSTARWTLAGFPGGDRVCPGRRRGSLGQEAGHG